MATLFADVDDPIRTGGDDVVNEPFGPAEAAPRFRSLLARLPGDAPSAPGSPPPAPAGTAHTTGRVSRPPTPATVGGRTLPDQAALTALAGGMIVLGRAASAETPREPTALLTGSSADTPQPVQRVIRARFDLGHPSAGPFPSNRFTVRDDTQNTGLRVNLPLPDCDQRPSDCQELAILNELDGFNLQPQLAIPFDGPIDVNTVTSSTVFLISLGDPLDGWDRGGQVVGINQVVWDLASNTLLVESDELLDQHTRYALIVTNGVRDVRGQPVEASKAFRRFRHEVRGDYRQDLLDALHAARRLGIHEQKIVTASVFTTMSTTAILEKIRDQIKADTPEPADFLLGPGGTRTVFSFDSVTGLRFNQQTRVDGPLSPVNLNLALLDAIPDTVGQLAFGKYRSPDYLTHPGEFIPQVGTLTGIPVVQRVTDIYFNLVLPSGPTPAGGWPVAIFGPGANGNKNAALTNVAASLAHRGIATLVLNPVGHGFGALSTLTVTQTDGTTVTFRAGGRGIDQNGDGVIDSAEGLSAAPPRVIQLNRDGQRQTVADLLQLVRVIEVGMDVDGDRSPDVDPNRIYYFGHSLGGHYGTQFVAIEPNVRAAVLTATGGAGTGLDPINRPAIGSFLAGRVPALSNSPGLTSIGGVPVSGPHFNENKPLRHQPPVINTVKGARAIQEVFERHEWVIMSGNPLGYAPHLRKDPLPGVPAKSVIVQFAKGDYGPVNPATTALLRAGDLADRATFYRHDLAYAENPALPNNPHTFMVGLLAFREIALGAQAQIAAFFASGGTVVIHPEPSRFFEVPIQGPLPEELNFIR